jgi:hypothetical protein
MERSKRSKNSGDQSIKAKVERIERQIAHVDPLREWWKLHNMKQTVITLTDVRIITAEIVGGIASFNNKCVLTPNEFQTIAAG